MSFSDSKVKRLKLKRLKNEARVHFTVKLGASRGWGRMDFDRALAEAGELGLWQWGVSLTDINVGVLL